MRCVKTLNTFYIEEWHVYYLFYARQMYIIKIKMMLPMWNIDIDSTNQRECVEKCVLECVLLAFLIQLIFASLLNYNIYIGTCYP